MSFANISSPWNWDEQPEPYRPESVAAEPKVGESKDGIGYGDRDVPYQFGHQLTVNNHFPFSTVGFSHLQRLRGLVRDGILTGDTL